jgi:gliding motility-associated lipoprotein GldD
MKINLTLLFVFVWLSFIFDSCTSEENATPKPRGYMRINLQKAEYIRTSLNCPFNFLVSKHSVFEKHYSNTPCWFNIVYPTLNASIHISYISINNNFKTLSEDTRTLVYKHTSKAEFINEKLIYIPQKKVSGILYEIGGNAASNCQFVLTDSVKHFIRGALYFNNKPNADSIAPVLNYIKNDIIQLMESTEWENTKQIKK